MRALIAVSMFVSSAILLLVAAACMEPLTVGGGDLPVETVAITPSALSVPAGQTVQLTVTPKAADGTVLSDRTVTWFSANPAIATVSPTGLVTGVAVGGVTIAATSEWRVGTTSVTVSAPPATPVTVVTVAPATASVVVGQATQLTATPRDLDGSPLSDREITWASSNPAIATVSSTGVVTGITAGAVTIAATSEGKTGFAAITVTATVAPVATVQVSPSIASVVMGSTTQLAALLEDAQGNVLPGRPVTWSSSNPAVASVNGSGLVTAMSLGSATITATSEGITGSAAITVSSVPVATVEVSPPSAEIAFGGTVQLSATAKNAGGAPLTDRTINWSSSNTAVASVNSGGLVTAVGVGTASITASSEGKSGAASVSATPPPVASVTVNPGSANILVGATTTLAAIVKDAQGNVLSGRPVSWSSSATSVATVSSTGLVTGISGGTASIVASSEGRSGTATVSVTTAVPVAPGTIADLTIASVTDNSVTLSFTEVSDGTGRPASYDVRFAQSPLSWGSATSVSQGTCSVPMAGVAIGTRRTCTVQGLVSSTAYQFQFVAYRGTLNVDAVFGGLSNVASGTTAASTAAVATVTVDPASISLGIGSIYQLRAILKDANGNTLTGRSVTWSTSNPLLATVSVGGLATGIAVGPATITASSEGKSGTASVTITAASTGGVLFQTDWSTATGTSNSAVTDGGRWMNYWEFNGGSGVQLMSVVPGGPGGRNALKVVQRGPGYAANLQQDNILPPATDFYLRFYMRNDDTSPAGDHVVTVDTWGYASLTFIRKMASSTGWRFVTSLYGCGYTYPIGHWGPNVVLQHGAWYRFEYHVDYVDATHIRVHPRVYDASGTLILSEADFRQSDFGSASWNGRSDWTLASYYAAGHSFCVNPVPMRHFGVGNNGQAGAPDTGLPWYFAGIQIRTDRWPGP